MRRSSTLPLLRSALVAALVAVGAIVAIPIGPVPVTLQVLVVAIATLVLSPPEAFSAVALYVALGAFGLPVFSGGSAGVGVLLGPTGGFIVGFLAGATLGAWVRRIIVARITGRPVVADTLAVLALLVVMYAAGLAQFALVTGKDVASAVALAVAPFVVIDMGKCIVALVVARALRAAGVAAG